MDEANIMSIIAEQLGVEEESLSEDTVFSDIGADSLDLFQIISALEEAYDIEINPDAAEQIKTIGDAMEYIAKAMEQEA